MFRMLGHIKRHSSAVAGALLLLTLLATIPLIKEINADGGEAGSTVAATVRIGLNNLEIALSAPDTVRVDDKFELEAVLRNTGSAKIGKVEATIHLPEGITVKGKETQKAGALKSDEGKGKKVKWKAVSDTPGSYVIAVTATGTDENSRNPFVSEASIMIEVTGIEHGLEVELSIPEVVGVGDHFKVEAVLQNTGSSDIKNIDVLLEPIR